MDKTIKKYKQGFLVPRSEAVKTEIWKLHDCSTNDVLYFVGSYIVFPSGIITWSRFDKCNSLEVARVRECKKITKDFKGKVYMGDVCVSDIWNKDELESNNVVNPNHYKGSEGLMAIDVMKNFMTAEQLQGYYLGNTFKYLLRFQKKNGLEDLYKAREHLNWLINNME